jgi:hypothetical protein
MEPFCSDPPPNLTQLLVEGRGGERRNMINFWVAQLGSSYKREYASEMPVIGQQLVGRTISVKFNLGWFNAEVLQVADGSANYKFTRSDKLNGVVPANTGFMFVHFFDDEKDLWVSCVERNNKDVKMFNGRPTGSWRLFN